MVLRQNRGADLAITNFATREFSGFVTSRIILTF